jgi:signal transduction histidine kinase
MYAPKLRHQYAWYFPALIILVLLIGIVTTVVVVQRVRASERQHLLQRSETIARALDPMLITDLSGTEADMENPTYDRLKETLMQVRAVNEDVRFVYIVGSRDGNIFFYGDSEPEDSEDMSPPGQIYDEASDILKNVFVSQQSATEGPLADRWGNWISAFSPMTDPRGEVIGVVGLDIAAHDFITKQVVNGAIPALITVIILIFLIEGYRLRRKEEEVMDLKSEFLSIAAHEIRTPLTGIRWASENLLNASLTPPQQQAVGKIQQSAITLIDRVNSLLSASKVESGIGAKLNRAETNVARIIQDVVQTLNLAAQERNINIVVEPTVPHPLVILSDGEKIRQALSNILSNAIKYSRDGGAVIIGYARRGASHTITITDSGIGIPKHEQGSVFKGYYRTSNAQRASTYGSGFGLYLAKNLIEAHGGTLTFTSEEGKGTVFTISLPVK